MFDYKIFAQIEEVFSAKLFGFPPIESLLF